MYGCLSEIVLQTQFSTITTVDVAVARTDEGDLTVCAQSIAQSNADTCLTRRNSLVSATIRSQQSSATLNIVGSRLTQSTFVAYMEICSGTSVIRTRPTCIGFYISHRDLQQQRQRTWREQQQLRKQF